MKEMKWNPFTHTKTGPYTRFIYSCVYVWRVEANNGNKEWMNEEPAQLKSERWEGVWGRAKGHDSMSAIEATTSLRARAQQQVDTFMRHLNDTTPKQVWPGRPYELARSLSLFAAAAEGLQKPLPTCDLRYRLTCKQLCAVRRGGEAAQQLQLSS